MQIISGSAKRINLTVPKGLAVRPTSVRARKALFDSLGDFAGATVVDLCAGSGALGLEAASRGAAKVLLVEQSPQHCRIIEENIEKVHRAGVECEFKVVTGNALNAWNCGFISEPDVIFADPPYAVSCDMFEKISRDKFFCKWAEDALLVWEIPDTPGATGSFSESPWLESRIRNFGGTSFLLSIVTQN
jgi:16S rRNA (guanine966-N2)-methyltransferase